MAVAVGLLTLSAGGARASQTATLSPDAAAGKRIAQRACGGCHAVDGGTSPLADAPPFVELHHRYPAVGLDQILQEGMLPPERPADEGPPPMHPRMPMVDLQIDQINELKAYLQSLDPRSHGGR